MKAKYFFILFFLAGWKLSTDSFGQNIGINTSGAVANSSAILDVASATKGAFVPRVALSATNNTSPITPAPGAAEAGLIVYNTATAGASPNNVTPGYYYWDGTKWVRWSGGSGGLDWSLLGNAGTVDGTNFIGTTDAVPFNIRVNNQKAGRIDDALANSFFGYQAGNANTTGFSNTANGFQALMGNIDGFNNTAIGFQTLLANTSGTDNTAIGIYSLGSNIDGFSNTALGVEALYSNTSGLENTAAGRGALWSNSDGAHNTGIGMNALNGNTSGIQNTAVGSVTLFSNTLGTYNTAIGAAALFSNTKSSYNTAVGDSAMYSQSYGTAFNSNNVAVGNSALFSNQPTSTTKGYNNTAVGSLAMRNNTLAVKNTALGSRALYSNTAGSNNVAIGYQALFTQSYNPGFSSDYSSNNVAVGALALYANQSTNGNDGTGNTAVGTSALTANTTGKSNTAVGWLSLSSNLTGKWNTAVGIATLLQSTGTGNTAMGGADGPTTSYWGAGYRNTSGSYNTFLGYAADCNTGTLTNASAIGAYALATQSNSIVLGSISGVNTSTVTTNVGIGTNAPNTSALLEVGNGADTKGFLLPRVSLTSTTDAVTVASPATSLMVYNTNASMTGGSVGFWYWDGTKWLKYITGNNTSVNAHCYTCDGF